MQCPVDNTTLVMSDRQGIEIDYCPQCRGVWLDRGEIDKIIERSQGQVSSAPASQPTYGGQTQSHTQHRDYDDDNTYYRGQQGHHKKHKESWFSEIFD